MANITKTIEDFSPLIVYSGNGGGDWSPGTSGNDTSLDQYSQASYMVTTTDRASLSFSFYGNSLRIFGSKRSNHGQYQVNIDSLVYPPANGQLNDTRGQFQTSLFSTAALALGYHTVRMTNLGTSPLDVDFITWQTPIGSSGNGPISNAIVDDSDTSIKYNPQDRWDYNPNNLGAVVGASVHGTTTAGASVEYEFEGNAIGIYGPVGPTFAAYSVQVDGGTATNFSATKASYRPQTMLFFTSNLADGAHTVKIQHESWNNSALSLAVDYFEVFSSKPIRASGSASSKALEPGPVAGIAVGSFVLALIISSIAFFFVHRRSKHNSSTTSSQNSESEKGIDTIHPYRPISNGNTLLLPPGGGPDTTSPPLTAASPPALTPLRPQVSDGSFNNTPPLTGSLWPVTPPTDGQGGSPAASPSADRTSFNPNVQVITVPYTADGKYRPDLANPAPQLLPVPPPSARRNLPRAPVPPSPIAEGSSSSSIYTAAATAGGTSSVVQGSPNYSGDPPSPPGQTNGPVITITAEEAEALNLIPAGTVVGDAGTVVTALHGVSPPAGTQNGVPVRDSVITDYGRESAPPIYVQDGPSVSRPRDEKR